jgi:CRISPR-associated endonuclease/helicase Cas3
MTQDDRASWLKAALGLPPELLPFPWQLRLLNRFTEGRIPRSLDLPTGLGKTSVIAIWLVARALGARVPTRLVYVVDRRAVVDQATDVAEGLMQTVEATPSLRSALKLTTPMPISTLRGQHVDNQAWLADPSVPAIVIGTLDMIGSRLLFGGYGVSRKMRPYHAGLLGADSLLVLDEAHLAPAFERLLERIASGADAHGRSLAEAPGESSRVVPPPRLLTLSATGRDIATADTFTLDDNDHQNPVVRARLQAPKHIRLFEAVDAKALPDIMAGHAWNQCAQGRKAVRTIVFVNRREHAQKIADTLKKLSGESGSEHVQLFVGGRRIFEREQAARRLAELGFLATTARPASHPAFLVATSAAEVGVDLDADHAVFDLVAWERMVQRLGRVNRRGTGNATVAVIPMSSDDDGPGRDRNDAVLTVLRSLPLTPDGAHDGSPAALASLKSDPTARAEIERASTPAPLHPPLTRAVVDAWAMTSLEGHTGRPEVAPWIRGWPEEPEPPQVCLVWRTHLPIDQRSQPFARAQMEVFLDAAGPHLSERLDLELPQVSSWLVKRAERLRTADRAATSEGETFADLCADDPVALLVADVDGTVSTLTGKTIVSLKKPDLERRLAGKTLLIDCRFGGLSIEGLLDDDADTPALDVSEVEANRTTRTVPFRVMHIEAPVVPDAADGWRYEASFPLKRTDEGVVAWLVVSSLVSRQAGSEEGRSGARRSQRLDEHQQWTEVAVRQISEALHLDAEYIDMLAAAAAMHDEGKKNERWQLAFHAPDNGRPPYAKTIGRPDVSLLDGYRHEFGSLPLAEASPQIRALPPPLRELCLHVIAAHHGGARPVIRTNGAAEPPSRAARRAREVAMRYATLSARWGPWGLAWWETVLRAADQQASRRNDEQGARHG